MQLRLEIEEGADVNIAPAWRERARGRIRVGRDGKLYLGTPSDLNQHASELNFDVRGRGSVFISDNICLGGVTIVADNGYVEIGDDTTINGAMFRAHEDCRIRVGVDCMFGSEVTGDTTDFHAIFDKTTKRLMNAAENVLIGDHVWIGNEVSILKGCKIGSGAIIGRRALVTKSIPAEAVAGGVPARVIKTGVGWSRMSPQQYSKSLATKPQRVF